MLPFVYEFGVRCWVLCLRRQRRMGLGRRVILRRASTKDLVASCRSDPASAVRSVRPGVFRGRQGMRSLIYPHRPFKKRKKAQYPLKQGMLRRKIA